MTARTWSVRLVLAWTTTCLLVGDGRLFEITETSPAVQVVRPNSTLRLSCSSDMYYEYCVWTHKPTGSSCLFEWKRVYGAVQQIHCSSVRLSSSNSNMTSASNNLTKSQLFTHSMRFVGNYEQHECAIEVDSVRLGPLFAGEWSCDMEAYVWGLARGPTHAKQMRVVVNSPPDAVPVDGVTVHDAENVNDATASDGELANATQHRAVDIPPPGEPSPISVDRTSQTVSVAFGTVACLIILLFVTALLIFRLTTGRFFDFTNPSRDSKSVANELSSVPVAVSQKVANVWTRLRRNERPAVPNINQGGPQSVQGPNSPLHIAPLDPADEDGTYKLYLFRG